jgi:hypothetical protein
MNRQMQAIIDALARQGIAIDIAGTEPKMEDNSATVRLRFDRVAMRFVGDVRSALHEVVPDGKMLMFTITAPIRLASKTADVLESRVRSLLARRTEPIDLTETIHGNQIRVRLLGGGVKGTTKVIGFVHNPDSDPDVLFRVTQASLDRAEPVAGMRQR